MYGDFHAKSFQGDASIGADHPGVLVNGIPQSGNPDCKCQSVAVLLYAISPAFRVNIRYTASTISTTSMYQRGAL